MVDCELYFNLFILKEFFLDKMNCFFFIDNCSESMEIGSVDMVFLLSLSYISGKIFS